MPEDAIREKAVRKWAALQCLHLARLVATEDGPGVLPNGLECAQARGNRRSAQFCSENPPGIVGFLPNQIADGLGRELINYDR